MRHIHRLVWIAFLLCVVAGLAGCGKAASVLAPADPGAASTPTPAPTHTANPPLGHPVDPSAQ